MNKGKIIEEMANEINEMSEPNAHYYDKKLKAHEAFADCFTIARYLVEEKGYRKIKENQVILTQEEYEYLCDETVAWKKDYQEIAEELEKAKQEVARDIFEELEQEAYKNEEGDLYFDLPDYLKIKKKYIGE